MRRLLILVPIALAGCVKPGGEYPSLAPRAAEAIDPRLPLPSEPSPGPLDAALAGRLASAVGDARGGVAAFDRLAAIAERAAVAAGASQGESWVVAQQALSALVAQHGVTTSAAGDIDAIAAARIDQARWISPANRAAIETAAAEVGAINERQAATIARLGDRLAR
jgi:hypothetical protein